MKRLMIIVNPIAGKQRIKTKIFDIITIFSEAGYEVALYPTTCRGNATEIVKSHGENFDLIVCCGGDGTLNEVISGAINDEAMPPVGYIPAGTTNDMANGLKIPKNILKAAAFAVEKKPKYFDIGRFNDRNFNYVACFGAFTEVSWATNQNIKNIFGHLAYVMESAKYITAIKPRHMSMEYEGKKIDDDFVFGAISNSTSMGGVVKLKKEIVDYDDGLFEVMLIRNPGNPIELQKVANNLITKNYTSECISFFQTSELKIKAEEKIVWSLDGERYDAPSEINIKNLKKAARLIY